MRERLRMRAKLFLAYLPFILVCAQFIVNVSYLLGIDNPEYLRQTAVLFGSNVLFSIFLVVYTHFFHFCRISRWSSIAELFLALDVWIIRDDNLYNLIFQSILLICGIIATLLSYSDKFPTCLMSLHALFIKKIFKHRFDCVKSLEEFKEDVYNRNYKKFTHHGR
jgi:hypothetical protein